MEELLKVLSVPENRTLIAWLGGGLSTVTAAGWVALKYLLDRRAKKEVGIEPEADSSAKASKPIPVIDASIHQSMDNSVSVSSGVAIGAGARVHSTRIHIGYGLRALFLVSLLAGLLLIAIAALAGRLIAPVLSSVDPMKKYDFSLSCGTEGKAPYRMDEPEAAALQEFIDFLEVNHGKPVYVSVRLHKVCAACACYRQTPIPKNLEMSEHGVVFVDAIPKNKRWQLSPIMKDAHQITAFGPPFSVSLAIYLPSYSQLPSNGQFLRGEYGSFLVYEGPFVANHFSGTGYLGGLLEPMSVMTKENLSEIECIRNASNFSGLQKLIKGCSQ